MHRLYSLVLCLILLLPIDRAIAEVKIGVIVPLTGKQATIGVAVKNGIELARSENSRIFNGVSFAYEDDQFDAKQGISAYRNLNRSGKPNVLLGFGNVLGYAIAPMVEKDKLPFINFSFEAGVAVNKPHIVRAMNHTEQYMAELGKFLQHQSDGGVFIVQTESSFFAAMVAGLKKAIGKKKKIVPRAVVNPDDTDFRPLIAQLKPFEGGLMGLFLWPDQLVAFLRQAKEMHFKARYFGTDLCETAALIATDPTLVEGCIYPDNNVTPEFRKRYAEKFGNEAHLTFAGIAYDMTVVAGEILAKNPDITSDKLLEALAAVQFRPGVAGTFSFRDESTYGKFFEYVIRTKRIQNRIGVLNS